MPAIDQAFDNDIPPLPNPPHGRGWKILMNDFFNSEVVYYAKPDKLATVSERDGLRHIKLPFAVFSQTLCAHNSIWLLNAEMRIVCVHVPSKFKLHDGPGFRTYDRAFLFLSQIADAHPWLEVSDLLNPLHFFELKTKISQAYFQASGEEMES